MIKDARLNNYQKILSSMMASNLRDRTLVICKQTHQTYIPRRTIYHWILQSKTWIKTSISSRCLLKTEYRIPQTRQATLTRTPEVNFKHQILWWGAKLRIKWTHHKDCLKPILRLLSWSTCRIHHKVMVKILVTIQTLCKIKVKIKDMGNKVISKRHFKICISKFKIN